MKRTNISVISNLSAKKTYLLNLNNSIKFETKFSGKIEKKLYQFDAEDIYANMHVCSDRLIQKCFVLSKGTTIKKGLIKSLHNKKHSQNKHIYISNSIKYNNNLKKKLVTYLQS